MGEAPLHPGKLDQTQNLVNSFLEVRLVFFWMRRG